MNVERGPTHLPLPLDIIKPNLRKIDVYRGEISLSLSRLPSDRFELPNQLSSRQDLAGHGCAILVEYKMGSRQHLNQDEIASMLENDDDYSPLDSDSEQEDCLVEDDVRSDNEDAMVDFIEDTSPTSRQDDPENHVASLESTNLEVTSSTSHRIITLPQRSIRGKNNHVWSTTKGRTTGRTSAINIIRTNRGPTRMCRNVFDPLLCFQLFITDKIVDEIVKWTNVEMIIKRQNLKEISASYRDKNAMEVWSLIGILTLTAVMKDNHLSTDELFDASFSGTR
ncbi:unnamed protein product [Arctia plantaginis]|uniref:PiggyBac transposable element-derived protein domain-containing protein n=1 Tax=Arctia plantaginis TaxID=874455 RepID=A0A8S1BE76_ARCPL|nr:unnamed protein product [Arctia plantaginis]